MKTSKTKKPANQPRTEGAIYKVQKKFEGGVDGSFVKGLLHDPIDREMVRSINEIGHLTGKKTIAEWAENAEIVEVLRGLGVDYAQGYGVSQPKRALLLDQF